MSAEREALRQCMEVLKLVDFADCAERPELWHKLNAAQQVAEEVLRRPEQSEIWHVQKLRDAVADPMFHDHAEVSKSLLIGAANIIEAASTRIAKLKSASQEPYAYAYECVQPGTDGNGWAQFINRDPVIPKDGVRNIIPLYASPVAAQQAAEQSEDQILADFNTWFGPQKETRTPQEMALAYWAQEAYRAGRLFAPQPAAAPSGDVERAAIMEEAAKLCDFQAKWAKGEAEDKENSVRYRRENRERQFSAELCAASIRVSITATKE
jgi:hypothetical protein